MKISLIAALSENRVIGKNNKLVWHIPDDLKHFKELTLGHPVIMGRKTFESIGRPLPGRTNIVITRDIIKNIKKTFPPPEEIVSSLDDAIERAEWIENLRLRSHSGERSDSRIKEIPDSGQAPIQSGQARMTNQGEVFIIGGGQIFEQAIKIADKLYLTIIKGNFEGDTFFPDYSSFKKVSESEAKEHNGIKYRFEEWEKK